MIYQEFEPEPELSPYIQLLWGMEGDGTDDHFEKEVILPDGIVEMVFHYADPFFTYTANGDRFLQPKGFAISQMRQHIAIESNGTVGFIAARCFPWGAYHFFTEPIGNFLDDTIDSQKLWPEHSGRLLHDLRRAQNLGERKDLLQRFLLARMGEVGADGSIDEAVRLLRDSRGQLSVKELCDRTGLSFKQLERKFLAAVGTTPKVLARVSRFLHVCHNLSEFTDRTLTELGYECGYYDQAHFIKEFRAFSGFTPKEFFARNDVKFADM